MIDLNNIVLSEIISNPALFVSLKGWIFLALCTVFVAVVGIVIGVKATKGNTLDKRDNLGRQSAEKGNNKKDIIKTGY